MEFWRRDFDLTRYLRSQQAEGRCFEMRCFWNGGIGLGLGRDLQKIEDVLLIRCGNRLLVEFRIELGDAYSVSAERAEVREDVVEALHGIIVVGTAP